MTEFIDAHARERAEAAHAKMDGHEQLCAERYKNIHDRVGLILKVLGWGGSIVTGIMLSVISFLAVRSLNTSDANQELLRMQLQQLQHVAAPAATQAPPAGAQGTANQPLTTS